MLQGLCVNRNMKIANCSHIKRFFSLFFLCCCCCFLFLRRSGRRNMQFSSNSSRLFHHTSESFSKRKDICFLMAASVRSRWLDIGRVLFLRFMELDFVSVYKSARKQRRNINRTTLVNIWLIIWQTDVAFIRIKNDSFLFAFREPGKNAICVCTTINPRVSSMFFFFYCLLPLFFIADIDQKLRTLLVRFTHFFPSGQDRPTRLINQLNNKTPNSSLVIAKLKLTSACS